MGNQKGRVFFWDLQSLELGDGRNEAAHVPAKVKGKARSLARPSSAGMNGAGNASAAGERSPQYPEAFTAIKPHKSVNVPLVGFIERKAAWSVGGEWCVVVGDLGNICIFRRWES